MKGQEKNSAVVGKILIAGTLRLKSPLLIGAGNDGGGTDGSDAHGKDIRVLCDEQGQTFIPGTSLAGVLRQAAEKCGYDKECKMLFGDMQSYQSAVAVADVKLSDSVITYRDGVRINSVLGTAEDGGKYDYEAVERGAHGDFYLEITLRRAHLAQDTDNISPRVLALAIYLKNLLGAGINLGALTSKGFGRVAGEKISAGLFDFKNPVAVMAWFTQINGQESRKNINPTAIKEFDNINISDVPMVKHNYFTISADFALASSFILRSGQGSEQIKTGDGKKVLVTLKSGGDYVIPGTSLKGCLAHRAAYIMEQIGGDPEKLVPLMGAADSKTRGLETEERIKSRFITEETYIKATSPDLVAANHTRNRIDRFTGGTIDSALFSTRPLWQKNSTTSTVHLEFSIYEPTPAEAGLALFLLKDLWQGKISLGGEKSVGRGALKGIAAKICYEGDTWQLSATGQVVQGSAEKLADYASKFLEWGRVE